MPGAILRARLLGAFDLWLGGEPLAPFDSARLESLLAYLLLHRDAPQPRQRLAFMLWPDSTEQQAQTNLRKVLHNLRRALPGADDLIDLTPRTLQWRGRASVDVEEFERALAEGRLEAAVETYTGELLEGRYDEWLLDERERLAGLYLDALERLTHQYEHDRRWAAAIRSAERLVAGDPLREQSHRLLIRTCHASGDRARALRAYHVCASTLERELGIGPSPATRALYEELIDAVPDADGASGGSAPFVGRAAEMARLRGLWREATGGRAQIVLVTGEAGVGKTRLVDELRAQASTVTVEARAYAAEGPVAYGLATAWLRADPVSARLPRLERAHLLELARLLPELTSQVPPPEPVPEAELRRRLFDAIGRALLAAGAPLLLIGDDVHWADTQSLRFLHYLMRAAPSARLLVACTARREELDENHPLRRLINAVQSLQRFTELPLERLDRNETALLAAGITGAPVDSAELDRLYGDSEGNPLFLVEALQPDAPAATSQVQAVIAGRLERLSSAAGELAGVGAAIGREFTADVLAAATSLDDQRFVSALDELWRRGIVRAHGPGAYDFTHGRIRDAAYARLSPPRRRQLHLSIAWALEHDEGAPAAAVAMHYDHAGATSDAIRWYESAAEAAQWLHAHTEAVRALERALTLSDGLPPGQATAQLQLRLLTAAPAPLVAVAGYGMDRLSQIHARAQDLSRQLGVELGPPLTWSMALAGLVRGDWDSGRKLGEQLRTRAEHDDDQVLWVESDYILGIAAYWPGHLADARRHFEAAMARFRPERRRAHVLRYGQDVELVVRLRLAHTLWLLGHDREADRQHDLALAAVQESTHPYSRAITYLWAAIVALDRADLAEFRREVQAVGPYSTDEAPGQIRLPVELFEGYLEALEGRRATGLGRVRRVQEKLVAAPFAPGQPGLATRILLDGYVLAGEARLGLALADEALGMGRGAHLWEAEIRRLRAICLAELGGSDQEVRSELERALSVAQRQRARVFEERIRGTLAERGLSDHRVP
jgi:DNA-binding SARP family transcriptional activator